LGRAESTVKAYLWDPTGEKARALKRRYQGAAPSCGVPTVPRGGDAGRPIVRHFEKSNISVATEPALRLVVFSDEKEGWERW
jgi:hypothetical protein